MGKRAELLCDTGDTAPEHWDQWLGNRAVHGVLWVNLRQQDHTNGSWDFGKILEFAAQIGQSNWRRLAIEILGVEVGWKNFRDDPSGYRYRVEHFGFNDGISQPFADLNLGPPLPGGGTPRPGGTWDPIAPGELLLGLPDEDGFIQDRPCNATLRNNGTYMAFRKLEQDVIGFRQFVADHDAGALPTRSKVASQFVGRWGNGTPIVVSPQWSPVIFPTTGRRANQRLSISTRRPVRSALSNCRPCPARQSARHQRSRPGSPSSNLAKSAFLWRAGN